MKRQAVLLTVIASLFAVLLTVYFVLIRPMDTGTKESETTKAPETENGEALGISNRYFLFTSLQREDIASIEVDNEFGGFTLSSDSDGNFHIQGFESLNVDSEKLASLISVSTYTLAKVKVGSSLSDEKLAEYGLDSPQASWIVTDRSGNRFRVFVGDRLLTGGGYYCMFDGRRSVYVLGNEVADTVLVPTEQYVNPVICAGISQDDYYTVDNFMIYKDGEIMARIRLVPKEEQQNPDALSECIMDYPTAYYPNTSIYYELIYKFMSFSADECVKIGATDSDFEKYGLADPAHAFIFDYKGNNYRIFLSSLTDDGKYYVYSNLFPDVIGSLYADSFKYPEYDLIKWIDPYVFQQYINDIDEISVESGDVSAVFRLTHIPAEASSDKKNEKISVNANGIQLSDAASENFRQFYKNLLAISVNDYCTADEYCPLSADELAALAANKDAAYLTFSYKKLSGESQTLRFYRYSTRHSLVTVDGVGEFYVLTDLVDKIRNDTSRILSGEEVVAYSKN